VSVWDRIERAVWEVNRTYFLFVRAANARCDGPASHGEAPGDGASFTTIYAGHFLDILISAVRCGASICPDVSVSQEAGVSRKTQEAISTCQIELCRD
jgi:hypothetical protein